RLCRDGFVFPHGGLVRTRRVQTVGGDPDYGSGRNDVLTVRLVDLVASIPRTAPGRSRICGISVWRRSRPLFEQFVHRRTGRTVREQGRTLGPRAVRGVRCTDRGSDHFTKPRSTPRTGERTNRGENRQTNGETNEQNEQ